MLKYTYMPKKKKQNQYIFPIVVISLIVIAIIILEFYNQPINNADSDIMPVNVSKNIQKSSQYPLAKEITTPDGFINSDDITIQELIGKKVILIDFWTYSCINCQRTMPYINAWYDKYEDQGLEIIGIHTPEFAFEQNYNNVLEAVNDLNIDHPVVLDNDYSTWNAYNNRYWPAHYLIDIDGYIVYKHFGEGSYNETEKAIQNALQERATLLNLQQRISTEMTEPQDKIEVDARKINSPEIYFGAFRNNYLANGQPNKIGLQSFKEPANIKLNKLYLVGNWDITNEFAANQSVDAKIIFRYDARAVNLVAAAETPATIEIYQDGNFLKTINVSDEKLYNLINDQSYGRHLLEIIIKDQGLQAFTFTFG